MTKLIKAVRLSRDLAALHTHWRERKSLSEFVEHYLLEPSDEQLLPDLCDLTKYSSLNHFVAAVKNSDCNKQVPKVPSNTTNPDQPYDQHGIPVTSINAAHITASEVKVNSEPIINAPSASVPGPSREEISSQLLRRTAIITTLSCDKDDSCKDLLPDLHTLMADCGQNLTHQSELSVSGFALSVSEPP
jgi:hypothetical protein